jgi:hypothetical protein
MTMEILLVVVVKKAKSVVFLSTMMTTGTLVNRFQVKISGLFSKNDDQLITFPRPVRAVCLDPNFARTKMFVTGDTNVRQSCVKSCSYVSNHMYPMISLF